MRALFAAAMAVCLLLGGCMSNDGNRFGGAYGGLSGGSVKPDR